MSKSIINHNRKITKTKYFSIEAAQRSSIQSRTAFIIANERITSKKKIGRYFTVFPSTNEFLKNRDNYPHCHEILVDHEHNKKNIAGRLVFDFDIKDIKKIQIPNNFKKQVENTILDVVDKYFKDVNSELFDFVWSTSENPKKFSKHLTVKNLYFDNWIDMSKVFYQLFSFTWDEKYHWIKSADLVDTQIVRTHGSLRMVGSTKIKGYPLNFDDDKYRLTDSLIRIYFKKQRLAEQLVTKNNINDGVFNNVLIDEQVETKFKTAKVLKFDSKKNKAPIYEKYIYDKAFELYQTINPNIFQKGKISGNILSLRRIIIDKPSKCILSGKVHTSDNAFLVIKNHESTYSIRFGCYRFCFKEKAVYIGSFTTDNHMFLYNPEYEPTKKAKKE